jgi:hypothetical protein
LKPLLEVNPVAGRSTPSNLLTALLADWQLLLQRWSSSGRFTAAAQEALLLDGVPQALKELVAQWSAGGFKGIPPIVLLQAGQFCRKGGELGAQLLVLLLLKHDERPVSGWPRQPDRVRNTSRGCAHHRRIPPEMQPRFKLLSTAQQSRSLGQRGWDSFIMNERFR